MQEVNSALRYQIGTQQGMEDNSKAVDERELEDKSRVKELQHVMLRGICLQRKT